MQQLCDMMGNIITKQTLSKYENGVMLPKRDIVIALCDSLEINPDYLFSYKTSSPRDVYKRQSCLGSTEPGQLAPSQKSVNSSDGMFAKFLSFMI